MFARKSIEESTEDPKCDLAHRREVDIDDKKFYFVITERMHVFSGNVEMLKPRKSSESLGGERKSITRADDKCVDGKWNNKKTSKKENVIKSRPRPDVARA